MRIVNVLGVVALASFLSACSGSKNVETAALSYTQDESFVLIDRGLDEKFGLRSSAEKDKMREQILASTEHKVISVEKRSGNEAEVAVSVSRVGERRTVKVHAQFKKDKWEFQPVAVAPASVDASREIASIKTK